MLSNSYQLGVKVLWQYMNRVQRAKPKGLSTEAEGLCWQFRCHSEGNQHTFIWDTEQEMAASHGNDPFLRSYHMLRVTLHDRSLKHNNNYYINFCTQYDLPQYNFYSMVKFSINCLLKFVYRHFIFLFSSPSLLHYIMCS